MNKIISFPEREQRASFLRKLVMIEKHKSILFAKREEAIDFLQRAKINGINLVANRESCGYLVLREGGNRKS